MDNFNQLTHSVFMSYVIAMFLLRIIFINLI